VLLATHIMLHLVLSMAFMHYYEFFFFFMECCTPISFIRILLVFLVFYMCRCKVQVCAIMAKARQWEQKMEEL
jgi:hypothetical protein